MEKITYRSKTNPNLVAQSKFGIRDLIKMSSNGATYVGFGRAYHYFWGRPLMPKGSEEFIEYQSNMPSKFKHKIWHIRNVAFHNRSSNYPLLFWLSDGQHDVIASDDYFEMVQKRCHKKCEVIGVVP